MHVASAERLGQYIVYFNVSPRPDFVFLENNIPLSQETVRSKVKDHFLKLLHLNTAAYARFVSH